MSSSDNNDLPDQNPEEVKPYEFTPEAEAVINRARRAALRGIMVLIIGVATVLGVVVYKVSVKRDAKIDVPSATVSVPAGAQILQTDLGVSRVTVRFELEGKTYIKVLSLKTGETLREVIITQN